MIARKKMSEGELQLLAIAIIFGLGPLILLIGLTLGFWMNSVMCG